MSVPVCPASICGQRGALVGQLCHYAQVITRFGGFNGGVTWFHSVGLSIAAIVPMKYGKVSKRPIVP